MSAGIYQRVTLLMRHGRQRNQLVARLASQIYVRAKVPAKFLA